MAHNTSRQAAAGYVRAQLVSGYADWMLHAGCDWCGRQTEIAVADLVPRWGSATVSRLMSKLRCSGCRRGPGVVQLHRGRRCVALAGPGSY
jgi:hypothetical protein